MDYFLDNWGSFVGLSGVIISIAGLIASLVAVYRAGKARDAAEEARRETRTAMSRALTTVDLERAIALVERLKDFHRGGRREASLSLYPVLKRTLADIRSRYPDPKPELQQQLEESILQIDEMENNVDMAIGEGSAPLELQEFNTVLNSIESNLFGISDAVSGMSRENG